jgi:hypothetical protein
MARGFQVQIDGIDNVARNTRWQLLGPPIRRFLERGAAASARDIRKGYAKHTFTGETIASIRLNIDRRALPSWGDAGVHTDQGRYTETGTKPHFPRIEGDLERWARSRGLDPYSVAVAIARKGTKRYPIVRRARFAARKRAIRHANDAAADIARRMRGT